MGSVLWDELKPRSCLMIPSVLWTPTLGKRFSTTLYSDFVPQARR